MPRPKTKADLLTAAELEYQKLDALIQPLNAEQMTQAGACETWSIKDILAHLLAWEQMVLSWYRAGLRGEEVKTPAADLKWSETPILNQRIYEQYRDVPLGEIRAKFAASHAETLETFQSIPEEALITPKVYKWTNTSTLLSYFVSCTSSHYSWAAAEIRKWLKAQAKTD